MEVVESVSLAILQLVLWYAFYWSVKQKFFCEKMNFSVVDSVILVFILLILWLAFYWCVKGKLFCEKNEWKLLKVVLW